MPKEKSTLRHIRRRDTGVQIPPAEAFLQVIGDGSRGAPSAVMLVTSGARYLFNCGEGTQRLINEHKMRLSRVENIFFTTNSWSNIGGLPGLSLTIKDMGAQKLTLHGPRGIGEIYTMTRRFMQVAEMQIEQADSADTPFSDSGVTIHSVHLNPEKSYPNGEVKNGKRRRSESPPVPHPSQTATAYLGKIADKPGALVMAKCKEFGVPSGPLLARLKDGEDVILANGAVVKAVDVCLPGSVGPVFLVVECPTEGHIPALHDSSLLNSYRATGLEVVVHLTPPTVLNGKKYTDWMAGFPARTQHLLLNDSTSHPNTIASYRIQAQLNMLDDAIFPLLLAQLPPSTPAGESQPEKSLPDTPETPIETIAGKALMSYYLRPPHGLTTTSVIELANEAYRNEALVFEGLKEALDDYRKEFPAETYRHDISEPEVTFLGTGAAIPSKGRNVSAILLRVSEGDVSMLLDCGEGTTGQMVRFFGPDRVDGELRRLKAVFLSHPHADHHFGLIDVIRARREAFKRSGEVRHPLVVFTPEPVISFFNDFSTKFESILKDIRIVECGEWSKSLLPVAVIQDVLSGLHMSDIKIVPVIHCANSFGICVSVLAGWKVCYSGDTMPCPGLVEAGHGCDLLLHEATMEDGMEEDAHKKRHSTTSQAMTVGRQMQAKFTLLTHFSQRYAKIPLLKDDLPADVGIAFDNMRVRLSDLAKIPPMMPALKLMFTEHVEEMQLRSEKLERRREELKSSLAEDESV